MLWTSDPAMSARTKEEDPPPLAYITFDTSGSEDDLPPPPPPRKSIFTNKAMSERGDSSSKDMEVVTAEKQVLEAETDNSLLALWDLVLNACGSIDSLLNELLNSRK